MAVRKFPGRGVRVKAGWKIGLISLLLFLWLISLGSQGFVGILAWFGEGWASTSWLERLGSLTVASGFIILAYAWVKKTSDISSLLAGLGGLLVVVGIIIYGAAYVVALNSNPSVINVVRLKEPIDTTSSRLIPLHTAYAYASSMLQTPTHTIYEDETYVYLDKEGHIIYNWIIEPEGFWNEISRDPKGVVLVNGSVFPPKVYVIKHDIHWGLHRIYVNPFYFDTLWRDVKLKAGLSTWVLTECNTEVMYGGKPYIIIPLASWEVSLRTTLPIPVGYAIISPNGSISVLSFREALTNPLFKGVPLVPDVIAREWVEAYKYFTGFWNVVLYHNTYVIRDVGTNPQPYLMSDEAGHLYWVFIAEPPGATYSAKYIFYVNASDPKPHIMIYELPQPVIGISKVASLIKQAHPTFDWSQFHVEEPMPIIANRTLYWKVTVITADGRGMVSIDFLNTETNEVTSIKPNQTITMGEVLSYLSGKAPQQPAYGNNTLSAILQRIRQLKQEIASQEKQLHSLYQKLTDLEKMVEELGSNQSTKG